MKKMKYIGRQGDVLIINKKAKSLSKETKERLFNTKANTKWDFKQENRTPLAYGEVSGHAHVFAEEGVAELTYSKDVQESIKHLKMNKASTLTHEEHDAIQVPKGDYTVLIQNEYRLKRIERTAD